MTIKLVNDTIEKEDVDQLIDWLKTYPKLTKGELTVEFEKKWSSFLGSKYSVFVNSGSSAILLMLYALLEKGLLNKGDKVVVPAVSWATDLAPVVQLGLEPILCDCNLEDLSVDLEGLEKIFLEEKPRVLLLVSVLGLVPDMERIVSLCEKNNVVLLEDACESLGSKFKDKNIGTFGLMSCFSTYFGHHMSTIEGGVVCTDNQDLYNILKAIRSHGWDRDLDSEYVKDIRNKNSINNDFEALYKFYYFGFNVRSTDLQAFLGIKQLEKLDHIIERRRHNYNLYFKNIKNSFWMPKEQSDNYISNFAFPIIHPKRSDIVKALRKNNVETRPLICGSIEEQPFWKRLNKKSDCKNAKVVNDCGLYLPNNHQITNEEIISICQIINNACL